MVAQTNKCFVKIAIGNDSAGPFHSGAGANPQGRTSHAVRSRAQHLANMPTIWSTKIGAVEIPSTWVQKPMRCALSSEGLEPGAREAPAQCARCHRQMAPVTSILYTKSRGRVRLFECAKCHITAIVPESQPSEKDRELSLG